MKKSRTIEGGLYESNQQFFEMSYKEPIGENEDKGLYNNWTNGIYTKVVLGVENEEELMKVYHAFQNEELFPIGVPMALITDIGKTEFHGQTFSLFRCDRMLLMTIQVHLFQTVPSAGYNPVQLFARTRELWVLHQFRCRKIGEEPLFCQ